MVTLNSSKLTTKINHPSVQWSCESKRQSLGFICSLLWDASCFGNGWLMRDNQFSLRVWIHSNGFFFQCVCQVSWHRCQGRRQLVRVAPLSPPWNSQESTQVTRFYSRCLYLLSHLSSPSPFSGLLTKNDTKLGERWNMLQLKYNMYMQEMLSK